jgi:hypothetical protein
MASRRQKKDGAMTIEFHCDRCGKLVRTPADNAGKRGRCPFCHQSVYIPTPADQIEPLDLSPVDETAEQRQERLMRESRHLTQRLLNEKEAPASGGPTHPVDSMSDILPPHTDVESLVVEYAQCMADGKLADAEEVAAEIRRNMGEAERIIERMTLDEIPHPGLSHIPRPVLLAFFKQLRAGK